ncbi:uncharacterized protein C8Q71DRAFT_533552 [Rhodofomes roseus]|uniref:Uncharacterized protein n=1 Tax=Rhodofomes roseus TaxID=34475 RepID=A0ABQ8KK55_9APHY|nr:uncharacterized protein C8Q71DRAFT_533552 [Rhodofomes roseus]KAH9838507.1 hypothetical protein C8Q71DRAFT_533552 [Rhodofomes roseus]
MSSIGSMFRRAPTPLRSAPSSGPMEAMAAKKQEQIEELVAKSRTLEHTIDRLRQALSEEQRRGSDAVAGLQKRFQQERAEWISGCDAIQAIHRLAHARTVIELDRERMAVLKEREGTRLERLARLQRDYRLVSFQRREFDLEKRVSDLERELEDQQRTHEEETRDLSGELEERCATLTAQLEDTAKELVTASKSKDTAEDALSKLRIEHNALVASTSSSTTNLERTTLHLEGLKSSYAELETKHGEAERTNADLRRQLEKWRTLESREGAEMDTLRRSRIELEVRVKELESRVEELEGEVTERNEFNEKAKAKVARYKTHIEQYKTSMQEHQNALDEARADADKAEMEAEEVKERLLRVEAELHALRTTSNARPPNKPSPADPVRVPPSISDHEGDDIADEEAPSSSAPPTPPRKSKSQQRGAASSQQVNDSDDDDVVMVEADSPPKAQEAKKKRGRPRKRQPEEDGNDEVVAKPTAGRKGKRKATDVNDSDDEPPPKKSKGKAKDKGDADEDEEPPKAKTKTKKPSASTNGKPTAPQKAKPGRKGSVSNAAPATTVDEDDEEAAPTPTKGKKRRIKLFPASQPVSFDWVELSQTGGALDIPSRLSPVKETNTVPPRSVYGGRGSSAFGSFGSLGGRR